MKEGSSRGFSAYSLKLIAAAAMLADHFAWLFVPTYSTAGQIIHMIGRMTIPIMCFFIAEGYYHSRSHPKYAARLAIFAVISQIPYHYFRTGNLNFASAPFQFSVIFTLLCSFLALWLWDKKGAQPVGWLGLFLLMILSSMGDWSVFAVLFTLAFAMNRDSRKRQSLYFAIIAVSAASILAIETALGGKPPWGGLFQFGLLLPLPLLLCYNGERGGSDNSKWFFYVFYPLHLMILTVLHQLIA
ncbi:TraX family protein [Clostridium minihomine]|uniref:TraX family protein n=1 Tax=Clostridium minihomine TaxID=2045012 RepID=UPI000C78D0B8|nr:TraX family protein [Clostridium minihomine]